MNVHYSEKAKQRAEEYALLRQATLRLEQVPRRWVDLVQAEWDREEYDEGQIRYTLHLSAWSESVSESFTPDELQSSSHMHIRLLLLWDSLLQLRNEQQLRELQAMGRQED